MAIKSQIATNTSQCPSSSQQLGRHTDPIPHDGRKTLKRNSEEIQERPTKRSRTSLSPSTEKETERPRRSTRLTTKRSRTSLSPSTEKETERPRRSTRLTTKRSRTSLTPSTEKETERPRRSTRLTTKRSRTSLSPSTEKETERPRRSKRLTTKRSRPSLSPSTEKETERPRRSTRLTTKRSRTTLSPSTEKETERPRRSKRTTTKRSRTSLSPSTEKGPSASKKTKSEETEGPRKRSRNAPSPSEGLNYQDTDKTSSRDEASTSSPVNTVDRHSEAAFNTKYREEELLGEGGFGRVYAGYRRQDNLPVAIKHIRQFGIQRTFMIADGVTKVPLEVALLLKLTPAAPGTSGVVAMLDWYDLDNELLLILERPVPCMDLIEYTQQFGLQEHKAKIIIKELVDTLIDIHSRGVFHRDIKPDNILIETSSNVPRARLIDFGSGTYLSDSGYTDEQGTFHYTSPEWFEQGWYDAEPTNVWQLGVTLFGMMHRRLPFQCRQDICFLNPEFKRGLTPDCEDFLESCLMKNPDDRPTLRMLQHHPWLK